MCIARITTCIPDGSGPFEQRSYHTVGFPTVLRQCICILRSTFGKDTCSPVFTSFRNDIRTGTLVRYLVYICVRTTVRIPVIVRSNNAVAYTLSNDATLAFLGTQPGGAGTICCLIVVMSPLTTHTFRDGAPFLLLVEAPPTFRHSLRFFQILHLVPGD